MKKSNKFFMVDTALVGLLLSSGLTGLVLWSVFPRGAGLRGAQWLLSLHKWAGLGLVGLGAYHFYLHWDWYKKAGSNLLNGDSKNNKGKVK